MLKVYYDGVEEEEEKKLKTLFPTSEWKDEAAVQERVFFFVPCFFSTTGKFDISN